MSSVPACSFTSIAPLCVAPRCGAMGTFQFFQRQVQVLWQGMSEVHVDREVKVLRVVLVCFEVDFVLSCQPADGGIQVPVRQSGGGFQVFITPSLAVVQQSPDDACIVSNGTFIHNSTDIIV